MRLGNRKPGLRLRIVLAPGIAIGPGKADLLDGISETGSIAAAGRRMGMSYKRAWLLVETLNSCFSDVLVETSRGGSEKGGAVLTAAGREVLDLYRRMEHAAAQAAGDELDRLRELCADMSDGK
ncbi:MAG: LysR family transcriptional regulator [Geminicoccaceae bacterium]